MKLHSSGRYLPTIPKEQPGAGRYLSASEAVPGAEITLQAIVLAGALEFVGSVFPESAPSATIPGLVGAGTGLATSPEELLR